MKYHTLILLIASILMTMARAESNEGSSPEQVDYNQLFNDGNTAFRDGNLDLAITKYRACLQANPNSPQPAFNLALVYEEKGATDDAIEAYRKAIELKPDYAKAHRQIAVLLKQKGSTDDAIYHYQQAMQHDPKFNDTAAEVARSLCDAEKFSDALPYFEKAIKAKPDDINLQFEYANTLNTVNRFPESLDIYYQLLRKRPNDSSILYNTAYTLKKMGRIEDAMPYYTRTLKHKPDHAEAHFSLGLAYLLRGDFENGWKEYEWRWQRNTQLSPREFQQPQWDGSPLNGKTILLHAEQGLGDTFQFIRYAKTIKEHYGATIIVATQRALHTLVSRCCPYIDKVITLDKMNSVSFDYHAPMLTLPLILKTTETTIPHSIPYIFPEEALVEYWRRKLSSDTNFKVGICWQGNSQYSTPFLRAVVAAKSVPAKKFEPFSQIHGVTFYSLQRETGTDQLKSVSRSFDLKTFEEDFDAKRGRFMDTAAVMKNLDLVITIDTSIAHLAGAIGIPVWVLIPEPPDWRWMLKRSDSPWYPENMRLFRQSTIGDWDGVIQTIVNELSALIKKASVKKNADITPSTKRIAPASPAPTSSQPTEKTKNAHHTMSSALQDELNAINKKIQKISQEIKASDASPDDEAFMKKMRTFCALSEIRSGLIDKIKALEE